MSTPNSQAPNAIKREMGGGGVSNKFSIFQDKQLKQIKIKFAPRQCPKMANDLCQGNFVCFQTTTAAELPLCMDVVHKPCQGQFRLGSCVKRW